MLRRVEPHRSPALPAIGLCRVAVIGGGFSGASVARCLALEGDCEPGEIVVFEPRGALGAGLAYDTADPALRLNVAAHRMRALPDRPDAFLAFLEESGRLAEDPGAASGADVYARRSDFADFMRKNLDPFMEDGTILHCRERVARVSRWQNGWHVLGERGTSYLADAVVIAIGHPQAAAPAALAHLASGDTRILPDPDRLEDIGCGDRVLIVGAGLTALDFLAALDRRGHKGPVTMLSRSGFLPQRQASIGTEPFGDFLSPPIRSARLLLREVRRTVGQADAAGLPWHSVFDALRKQGQGIWRALPPEERARFLRHLRRRYEIHRFRMPPQNDAVLRKLCEEGRLETLAGQIERAGERRNALETSLRLKPDGRILRQVFDRIAIATGPDQQHHFRTQPWLENLRAAGHLMPAPHGLGIACDRESRAVGADGAARDDLFVIGPPTRAAFWEITGAPEIAAQASAVARLLHPLTSKSRASLFA